MGPEHVPTQPRSPPPGSIASVQLSQTNPFASPPMQHRQLSISNSDISEFGAYPAVIARELDRFLPFLATTAVLMAAVRAGVGRETGHEIVSGHALAVALDMREKGVEHNDLLERLAADPRLGLAEGELRAAVADPAAFVGAAGAQVAEVVRRVGVVTDAHPQAAAYAPAPIL